MAVARPPRTGRPPDAERSAVRDPKGLNDLVADVRAARPRLLDRWEATALVESLGYTDLRVQRDFGFADTLAAGTYVYSLGCPDPAWMAKWVPKTESVLTIVTRGATSTLIYAVPWLTVFVAQIFRPNAMRLPSRAAPALALALMFSLIWSGGCVQAIVRRGEFYVGLRQLAMARDVVETLLRIGLALTVAAALAGVFVAWYFELFPWPSLVLGANAFIIMSVLWMVCGTFAIRQQQWRVAIAFAAGFVAFAVARSMGADVLSAHLTAAAVVLMAATWQLRHLFSDGDGLHVRGLGIPLPRLSVMVYWTVPYFWYGIAYFAFLFADRLVAGTALAALANVPFGLPEPYNFGMELALLTLLVAASGVEVAGALFARAFRTEAVRPLDGATPIGAVLSRHHNRAMATAFGTFAATAVAVAWLAHRSFPNELTPLAWSTLIAGDIGYACLAIGFVNALVLFETKSPWTAVQTLTAALILNLVSGYVLSHVLGAFYAVYGLLTGAAYFAISSTAAVRRTLRRPDYAYALG